ncbi:MAG: hypothetical protein D6782_01390, partial [Alphaproteobacteria bacterium]
VNPQADIVLGAFKVSTTGGLQGVANLGWFAAGGTYMHVMQPVSDSQRPNERWHCDVKAAYTFFASGGALKLRERVGLRAHVPADEFGVTSTTLLAVTFTYKLFVGLFV